MTFIRDSLKPLDPQNGSEEKDRQDLRLGSVAHLAPWVSISNAMRTHRKWCLDTSRETVVAPPLSNATRPLRTVESPLGFNDALRPPTNPYKIENSINETNYLKEEIE
jgi:hypothetical protein